MKNETLDTKDRILNSAIDLFAEKGFKNTTAKEIALSAAVSEMTVFRIFETKRNILEEAIKRFSFEIPIKNNIQNKIAYDLIHDLSLISKVYHKLLALNEKVILIKIKESKNIQDINIDVVGNPKQLKIFLIDYFTQMYQLGKIINTDFESQAMSFIWINFGFFCSTIIVGSKLTNISENDFIENTVKLFAKALLP